MKELSLHILDIAKNSVTAGADLIEITVCVDENADTLSISIQDNGCGMSEDFLKKVRDPFVTTRTTRKAGLGIPLFEAAAIQSGGSFDIKSKLGEGTCTSAVFGYSSIDRAPLGDMGETMIILISGSSDIQFVYKYIKNGKEFVLDTNEIKQQLGNVSISEPEILNWIGEYIKEGTNQIS